jgi:hypothetical protein
MVRSMTRSAEGGVGCANPTQHQHPIHDDPCLRKGLTPVSPAFVRLRHLIDSSATELPYLMIQGGNDTGVFTPSFL